MYLSPTSRSQQHIFRLISNHVDYIINSVGKININRVRIYKLGVTQVAGGGEMAMDVP